MMRGYVNGGGYMAKLDWLRKFISADFSVDESEADELRRSDTEE
jgi:hypothetical protein